MKMYKNEYKNEDKYKNRHKNSNINRYKNESVVVVIFFNWYDLVE